jgi:hypothetical protein
VRINLKTLLFILFGFGFLSFVSSCSPKSESDCGFVQNIYGQRISWKQKLPVDLAISATIPVDLKSAIYRASATWEKKMGQKVFALTEDNLQAGALPGRDKKNGIYFLNNWESDKKSEQGRTSVYWAGDEIQEADIRINAADFSYYNENQQQLTRAGNTSVKNSAGYSFEALVLHEMGHFLGLKHSEGNSSVMATYLSAFSNRTEPASVDSENVQCEYK